MEIVGKPQAEGGEEIGVGLGRGGDHVENRNEGVDEIDGEHRRQQQRLRRNLAECCVCRRCSWPVSPVRDQHEGIGHTAVTPPSRKEIAAE